MSNPPAPHRMRLGVYGGAFDPVHNTHLAIGLAATRHLALDALVWVPTGSAWHKARALTPAADRLAMLRLAFASLPAPGSWRVDTCEIDRAGPSYSVDTLAELRARRPGGAADWFLVIGSDQAAALPSWERWREVARQCTLAVVCRAGVPLALAPEVRARARWVEVPFPARADSSTCVRALAAAASAGAPGAEDALRALVPPPVARYIAQHHLYH